MHNALPTLNHLKIRNVIEDDICKWCHREVEDTKHLLWLCPLAKICWENILFWFEVEWEEHAFYSLPSALLYFNNRFKMPGGGACLIAMLWTLWLTRNECVFANNRLTEAVIVQLFKSRAWE